MVKTNLKVLKAKKSDWNAIAEIYMEAFSGRAYNEKWTKVKTMKKLNLLSRYCDFYIIKYNRQIGGFMMLNPTKWDVGKTVEGEEFAIKNEFRKKGIGKFFLSEIEKIYKNMGFKSFIFMVHKSEEAYSYYKKLRYRESKLNALFEVKLK